MNKYLLLRIYIILSASAILFAGLLHLFRLVFQVPVLVGSATVPMFLSYFGLAGCIGIMIVLASVLRKRLI